MTTISSAPVPGSGQRARVATDAARWFHSGAAALLLVLTFIGFQQFFLRLRAFPDRELTPDIRTLVIAHGVCMTVWMLLLVVQPLLVATGRRRLHMRLGVLGALLAAVVVVQGYQIGVESFRATPPEAVNFNLTPPQFLAVPFTSITLFAGFVGVGLARRRQRRARRAAVARRRQREVHRSLILLGTLAASSASIARIDALNQLYAGTVWDRLFGPFFTTLLVGALFLVVKAWVTRSLERSYVVGFAVLTLGFAACLPLARSAVWANVAESLRG